MEGSFGQREYRDLACAPTLWIVLDFRGEYRLPVRQLRMLKTLAENACHNNFSIDDLRGGTFTISNLGAIGGTYSTPIINVPEVAILLVGRARKIPVVVDDENALPI